MTSSTSPLVERKVAEVRRKLARLDAELAEWHERSETIDDPFAKHHSQIRRIRTHLGVFRKKVENKIVAAEQAGRVLEKWQNLTELILILNQIWAFYRSKLSQRQEILFKAFLTTADELAWECYRPAQEQAKPDLEESRKEPPLLFLSGHLSPFALARENPYHVPGLEDQVVMKTVLNKLPIPVIGVPWSLAGHLPAALVIGHEAGHAVEDDFGLTDALETNLETAFIEADVALERREVWKTAWLGEVFADIYGCLATGPAFLGSLMDFLAVSEAKVVGEKKSVADAYPTKYLRVLLCVETLKQVEAVLKKNHDGDDEKLVNVERLSNARTRIEQAWRQIYASHAMPEFEADIPTVVSCILEGPYPTLGGLSLKEVLIFDGEKQKQAEDAVAALELELEPASDDVRELLAAGWLSYDQSPADFDERSEVLQKRLIGIMKSGLRAVRGFGPGAPGAPAETEGDPTPATDDVAAEEAWALIESIVSPG